MKTPAVTVSPVRETASLAVVHPVTAGTHYSAIQGVDKATLWGRVTPRILESASGCWLWLGQKNSKGYGRVQVAKVMRAAHRVIYELLVGPIPKCLSVDHLCRVRNCVNPAHMDLVTTRVNVLRGQGHTAANARKTACKRGHPLGGANLYVDRLGHRRCRICTREKPSAKRAMARTRPLSGG
jgi:hypothetical protein